ncbi:uncharacterized protein T551_01754 [Pneumocystis jirovecii RU7]|uniref:Extracellular membrane protein CFEM domain-containing protein n=1 Tax=Pneumocystis jirovecii (strain RU7) TaxID=1408657 RepID=A0A0W4ZQ17_PNEJ7|nr:uncharacterized protein T551_01754 [Pneumocystis jirovecii RU7]KTW30471.1 hypothetical protein T551_01754 [Pneumocystis jirovecii RU7]
MFIMLRFFIFALWSNIILSVFGAESENCVNYFNFSSLSDSVQKCYQTSLTSSLCRGKYDIQCLCKQEHKDLFLSCVYQTKPSEGFDSAKYFSDVCKNITAPDETCLEEIKPTVKNETLPSPTILDEDIPDYHSTIQDEKKTSECSVDKTEEKPSSPTSTDFTRTGDFATTCTVVCVTRSKTLSSESTELPTQSSCLKGNCSVVTNDANSLKVGTLTMVFFHVCWYILLALGLWYL